MFVRELSDLEEGSQAGRLVVFPLVGLDPALEGSEVVLPVADIDDEVSALVPFLEILSHVLHAVAVGLLES